MTRPRNNEEAAQRDNNGRYVYRYLKGDRLILHSKEFGAPLGSEAKVKGYSYDTREQVEYIAILWINRKKHGNHYQFDGTYLQESFILDPKYHKLPRIELPSNELEDLIF